MRSLIHSSWTWCRLGMLLAVLVQGHACWGQASSAADEAAIRQAAKAYIEALHRGDAAAAAATWTDKGKFIDASGKTYKARDFIEKNISPAKSGDVQVDVADVHHSTIRFLTQNVAVEEGGHAGSGDSESGDAACSFSAVWVKQGNKWLLESVHEAHVPATNPLIALAWLVGDWTASHNDLSIRSHAAFTDHESFIVQTFSISKDGHEIQSGSQRIGWDPSTHGIRSWVFDSHGGFSEGTWRREGEAWIVKSTGVLPDGGRSTGLHFWMPEGKDRVVVKHSHVEVNGTPVEDVVLEFSRVSHGK